VKNGRKNKMVKNYGVNNQYDDEYYCPVCNSSNNCELKDSMEHIPLEYETICRVCKHKNYWITGNFILPYEEKRYKNEKDNDETL